MGIRCLFRFGTSARRRGREAGFFLSIRKIGLLKEADLTLCKSPSLIIIERIVFRVCLFLPMR